MDTPAFSKPLSRTRLIAERCAQPLETRMRWDATLLRHLLLLLEQEYTAISAVLTLGLYLPMQGEPDLTVLFDLWPGVVGLPEVTGPNDPLRYLRYAEDVPLEAGRHGTRVPAVKEEVTPDIIIAPCVGFFVDPARRSYRLGFGGGFFDRTAAAGQPIIVGVAYAMSRLPDFVVEPHDAPLAAIVTEEGPVGAPNI